MGFKCGIVGLPNVGKSTLFNALTRAGIDAENFPFCTIEPNTGIVPVPDERLTRIAELVAPERIVPTTMEFVDIAGLVAGASQGEGLGNRFLAHIREMDAIAHVVRCFDDGDVVHFQGRVSPREDVEIIDTELALADLETLERALERNRRAAGAGDEAARTRFALLERVAEALKRGRPARALELEREERRMLREYHLLTAKPVLFIANVAEDGFVANPLLDALEAVAAEQGAELVAICNKLEAELAELEPEAREELLTELGMEEPGLNRVIRAGYRLLGLHNFFTAGPKEVRAWTVRKGTRAPQAAGAIHSDFERGFIRAEVVAYEDFIAHGGEQGAKHAGKWRLEGKDYVVRDGDVIRFRFNV